MMGEIIARNVLSWLKLLIKLLLLHLVGCLYYCINDARSHKHQITFSHDTCPVQTNNFWQFGSLLLQRTHKVVTHFFFLSENKLIYSVYSAYILTFDKERQHTKVLKSRVFSKTERTAIREQHVTYCEDGDWKEYVLLGRYNLYSEHKKFRRNQTYLKIQAEDSSQKVINIPKYTPLPSWIQYY